MGGAGRSEDAAGVATGLNNRALEPQRKWKWPGILSLQLMMGGGAGGAYQLWPVKREAPPLGLTQGKSGALAAGPAPPRNRGGTSLRGIGGRGWL